MLHHTSHEDLPLHVQDKANGLCYTRNGDYYFPDLELPPQQPLGRWARLHLRHLQAHHPAYVQRLLLTGTLSEYLHTVDQQASERYDTLMKGYAKSWEITESLKSEDPMQWVRRMQLARSEAEHNVMTELICI